MSFKVKFLLLISFFVLIIITFILVVSTLLRGFGELEVKVFPNDTSYTVDKKTYTGNQVIRLRSGNYKLLFKRELFKEKEESVTIKKNTKKILEIILEPGDEIDNLTDGLSGKDLEYVDAAEQAKYQREREGFLKENPIVNDLPLIYLKFRIDYAAAENPEEIKIEITLFTEYVTKENEGELRKEALEKIKSYNINEKSIIWYKSSKDDFSN